MLIHLFADIGTRQNPGLLSGPGPGLILRVWDLDPDLRTRHLAGPKTLTEPERPVIWRVFEAKYFFKCFYSNF